MIETLVLYRIIFDYAVRSDSLLNQQPPESRINKALVQSIFTMRSSFSARRHVIKVGHEEDEEMQEGRPKLGDTDQGKFQILKSKAQISNMCNQINRLTAWLESSPNAIRPSIASRGYTKNKKRSSLRMSFGPGGTSMTEDDEGPTSVVFTPKKSNLSRQAIKKNALRKTLASNLSSEHLPLRQTDERPSYSADVLNELKTSTPSKPKAQSPDAHEESKTLDLASKFGSDLIVQDSHPAIPTATEIREKKERRARLAKEQNFISLDDDNDADEAEDSEGEMSLLPYARPKSQKIEETRLVRDDEDIAEGFDEFVSDGRIALGKKAERERKRRYEADIRDLINEAEGGHSSANSSDDSEAERHAAYEAAQTRKGMDGLRRGEERVKPRRPGIPQKITPLPTLAGCMEKIRQRMAGIQHGRMQKVRRLEEVREEREDIGRREVEIQRLLREKGEEYERLKKVVDGGGEEELGGRGGVGTMVRSEGMVQRGLEDEEVDEKQPDEEGKPTEEEEPAGNEATAPSEGMQLGMGQRGMEQFGQAESGTMAEMARYRIDNDDDDYY